MHRISQYAAHLPPRKNRPAFPARQTDQSRRTPANHAADTTHASPTPQHTHPLHHAKIRRIQEKPAPHHAPAQPHTERTDSPWISEKIPHPAPARASDLTPPHEQPARSDLRYRTFPHPQSFPKAPPGTPPAHTTAQPRAIKMKTSDHPAKKSTRRKTSDFRNPTSDFAMPLKTER